MLPQPSCLATLIISVDVPVLREAPVDDRLLDPAVLHGSTRLRRFVSSRLGPQPRMRPAPRRPPSPRADSSGWFQQLSAKLSGLVSWFIPLDAIAYGALGHGHARTAHLTPAARRLRVPIRQLARTFPPHHALARKTLGHARSQGRNDPASHSKTWPASARAAQLSAGDGSVILASIVIPPIEAIERGTFERKGLRR